MSSDEFIDITRCLERIDKLYTLWNKTKDENETDVVTKDNYVLRSVDAIIIIKGHKDDDSTDSRDTTMQIWLFGDEIHDILVVFCQKSIIIYARSEIISYLRLKDERKKNVNTPQNFTFLTYEENNESTFTDIIEQIKHSYQGKTLGVLSQNTLKGMFGERWQDHVNQQAFITMDIGEPIAYLLSIKDDQELGLIRKACEFTGKLYVKYLKNQIVNAISSDKRIKHSQLSAGLKTALRDEKLIAKSDLNHIKICYPAIIQSGGNYRLNFRTNVDKNLLHHDGLSIVCAFGIRYKWYCSNLVRTLLINPSEEVENTYKFLIECEELIINELKHDVQLCNVYRLVREKIENERPEFVNKMTDSLGMALGIAFQESTIAITNQCTVRAKKGMTFQISIGFSDLNNPDGKDEQSKTYALFIGDTVLVNDNEPCTVYTSAKKDISYIAIIVNNDTPKVDVDDKTPRLTAKRTITTRRNSNDTSIQKESWQEYQKRLLRQVNERAKARLVSRDGEVTCEKTERINTSYLSDGQLPQDSVIQDLKLYVDKRYETVILPIYGTPTPFHISIIKNVSLTAEGEFLYLRINFFHFPGIIKQTNAIDQGNIYIKEITYRASNKKQGGTASASNNLSQVYKLILEIQKKFKDKEQKTKQMQDVVRQPSLVLNPSKMNPKLKDLCIRPTLTNKKSNGTLEAHTNGFRYTTIRGEKIDIIYSNISHGFYQSCDNEMIILIHFHLKHAILLRNRQQTDMQFYTEIGEVTTDVTKHRNMSERDDVSAERADREFRKKLKNAFQGFVDKVVQQRNFPFVFEKPFRELSFHGALHQSMVLIIPTTTCVVQLTEWPPMIIELDKIELVHFERVDFQRKTFEMIFIMKDYSKKTQRIVSISMNKLASIKSWLNSCEICYTEGPKTLNWIKIMKNIAADPVGFFASDGWMFLEMNSDETQEQGTADDSDANEEDYDPDDDDEVDEGESDSEYSGEVEEEENDSETNEESGKSWSELEEEARKDDAIILDRDWDNSQQNEKAIGSAGTSKARSSVISEKRPASPASSDNKKKK